MPEVVSLLSSSPIPSPARSVASLPKVFSPKLSTKLDFDIDDFDETGDLDFAVERPSKRRKSGDRSNHVKDIGIALDLSSDIELPVLESTKYPLNNGIHPATSNDDDIVFSSSAPARTTSKSKQSKHPSMTFDLSSDSLPDDPFEGLFSASQPQKAGEKRTAFSEKTANLLAGLIEEPSSKSKRKSNEGKDEGSKAGVVLSPRQIGRAGKALADDITVSSPVKQPARKPKVSNEDAGTKKTDPATKRSQKAAEKAAEKEKKQFEKAQKARDKQLAADLAEVNKSKTKKKDAVVEMLVELPGDIQGMSVGNQLEEHMKTDNVSWSYAEEEVDLQDEKLQYQRLGSVVRWKRKVIAAYDEDAGQWLPASTTKIKSEQHVLVYLKAIDFAMVAAGYSGEEKPRPPTEDEMKESIDLHVATLRSRHSNCTPVYVIEGLYAWLKKNHNTKNREYTAAVRAQQISEDATEAATSSQARPRKRKKPSALDLTFITEDIVEDLLLHLQLTHQPIFIQHTTSASTTAEQIHAFTNQLSTRPYRQIEMAQNLKTASFCMATGQVRTGDDAKDTYIKMLQEVQRVTPAMACGIEGEFSSVRELVEGFRKEGNLMLEDVRKSTNKDGGWSDRRLGPMVSKRLYKVFMGKDPASLDGMS